jgi:hypothetical protein
MLRRVSKKKDGKINKMYRNLQPLSFGHLWEFFGYWFISECSLGITIMLYIHLR